MTTTPTKVQAFLDAIGGMSVNAFGESLRLLLPDGSKSTLMITTVANQADADKGIPWMLAHEADLHVVWAELSGYVDFTPWLEPAWCADADPGGPGYTVPDIDWLILSGSLTEPTDLAALRWMIADCRAAGVAVWLRSVGSHLYWMPKNSPCPILPDHVRVHYQRNYEESKHRIVFRDPTGSDPAEWPEALRRVREVPAMLREGT